MINLKKINILVLICVVSTFFSIEANAQGGSNYSMFGFGYIPTTSQAAYDALGGTCIAFPLSHAVNPQNPAMWSSVNKTRLQAGYRFNQHVNSDDNVSLRQNNGKIDGISAIFAIDTSKGIAASFGLLPYSDVNYLMALTNNFEYDGISLVAQTTYQGSGGLNRAYVGGCTDLGYGFTAGAEFHATFGVLLRTITTNIIDKDYYTAKTYLRESYFGSGFKGGLLFSGLKNWKFGLFYEANWHLNRDYERELLYYSTEEDTIVTEGSQNITLPSTYGFGFSYDAKSVIVGADITFGNYSNMDLNRDSGITYKNTKQYSIGLSFPGKKGPGYNWLDKVTYNIGAGYKELYYVVKGNELNEYYGSFGVNIPMAGTGIIDATVTLGSKGKTTNGLVKEMFGRLSVDISIGEDWFKPFKRQ